MKKLSLMFAIVAIFVFGIGFAFASSVSQDTVNVISHVGSVDETETSATFMSVILAFFVPGLIGGLSVLISDAAKYINTPDWSWGIFLSTKIKPFLIVTCLALVILIVTQVFPDKLEFLSKLIGSDLTQLTSFTLFATATAIFDGWLKKK